MSILIACSPSSGSSLLRRILNRHPEVFCGSETSLFAKKQLYTDWQRNKYRLLLPSFINLRNSSWHHQRGIELDEEYPINKAMLREFIRKSNNFESFIEGLYKQILDGKNKKIWAEKTPANAFTSELFLEHFPEGRLIHITRNPYDAMASLINRGMNAFDAFAVVLINTAYVTEQHHSERYHCIRYEELVENPQATMKNLCFFMGIEYSDSMLDANKNQAGVASMPGWNYRETDKPGTKSIGRFETLNEETQVLLIAYSKCLAIKRKRFNTLEKQCNLLSYAFLDKLHGVEQIDQLKKAYYFDQIKRTLKFHYYNYWNYPIKLNC